MDMDVAAHTTAQTTADMLQCQRLLKPSFETINALLSLVRLLGLVQVTEFRNATSRSIDIGVLVPLTLQFNGTLALLE